LLAGGDAGLEELEEFVMDSDEKGNGDEHEDKQRGDRE
jgi:hypothetical protein